MIENADPKRVRRLHLGVAEKGKSHAVDGEHVLALTYYREAMRMAVHAKEPEIYFRHYLECTLESLELMRSYGEVLEYCDRALAHYEEHPPEHPLARRDLASIHERRGAVLIKSGETAAAREALRRAVDLARQDGGTLPLADKLLGWAARGLRVEAARVTSEQQRHGYFAVRPDTVDRGRAIALPDAMLGQPARG